jgi:hypothetical protein
MAKAFNEWKVLPHEPIVTLSDNLLWVRGAIPGMSLKRVMVVVRLADGQLLIHNGIALGESGMAELERFGTPAFLVAPSGGRRLDAPAYKQRYPALRVFAPRGSREKVEQVLPVDGCYEDFPASDGARFERLNGVDDKEGVLIVRSDACDRGRRKSRQRPRRPRRAADSRDVSVAGSNRWIIQTGVRERARVSVERPAQRAFAENTPQIAARPTRTSV